MGNLFFFILLNSIHVYTKKTFNLVLFVIFFWVMEVSEASLIYMYKSSQFQSKMYSILYLWYFFQKKSSQSKEEQTEFIAPEIFVTEQYLNPKPNTGLPQETENSKPKPDESHDGSNVKDANT